MLPPILGLLAWLLVLLLLLRYDGTIRGATSHALWLPVVWLFFMGSRLPAQWLGVTSSSLAAAFEEGSPVDRMILLVLIVLAACIMATRKVNWGEVFRQNFALASLLLFALASVLWSDFPFITFKRWLRDLGTYMVILLVLSERQPIEAISTLLRRMAYLLIIVSIILIKYYPYMAVMYNPWTGAPEYTGAATSKNTLGVVCLIAGLYFAWDSMNRWPERKARGSKRALAANGIMIVMALWLLNLSQSATSTVCLMLGCLIMLLARTKWVQRNPRRILVGIPVVFVVAAILESLFDLSTTAVQLLGRDPSLTGRTGIWGAVLALQTNPLLGVGYQSFWLGGRLMAIFRSLDTAFMINEAHNGYLEVYLNLGLVGLTLLMLVLATSYRTISRQMVVHPRFASFSFAFWATMLVYNISEAGFISSVSWIVLLILTVAVPRINVEAPAFVAPVRRAPALTMPRQPRPRDA